ncbi:lipid A biosynthesis acyltransferase [Comamonas serinivorans]|uniref:Lipid A biosynthesis acyltransferase n=1 Tax=Comamonas serinivorans TaxID=1082851 RepID=A0A1Y0ETF4_9BURK|nr:lysophospholipid acyltransferase family protein [Comamonas serinivorans]ARU06957.1 lipid A biosynthesis acyltransferase [Comamonas serinivorans]
MVTLFRFLSHWPLGALHVLGAMLGWLTYWASPTYRKRVRANSAQAGVAFERARGCVAHAGRMVAEIPRLWLGRPVPMSFEGEAILDAVYGSGKGVIFLTPHLGCFESTAQLLAERKSPHYGPLTVLYRPPRQAWLQQFTEASRKRPGLETAPTTLPGVRQMIKALRQGRAVGLLPDQVPPDGQGIWSEAFGKPAYTMTLAARLALQTGAALVPLWGERLSGGRGFVVHVCPPLALPAETSLEEAVLRINRAMEEAILSCPDQYLWGYGRYKQPRPNA